MKSRRVRATIWLVVIAAVIVALDQYTKGLIRANLDPYVDYMPVAWLDRFVTLTYVQNTGAAFGLFQGGSSAFIVVAALVIVMILAFFRREEELSPLMVIALALMLSGATGNLIDRLARGFVTDFVNLRWWPVFNVADSAIVIGTILLAIYILFFAAPEEQKTPTELDETLSSSEPGQEDTGA